MGGKKRNQSVTNVKDDSLQQSSEVCNKVNQILSESKEKMIGKRKSTR